MNPSLSSGKMDDAIKLADLVELLARHGRLADAADAFQIAGQVELLLDQLRAEIDAILASCDRHAAQ
jgi:hypothetical protein